ncbi:MAG: signal peptide peptidase SppA [Phycisphaerae bacterium]
MSTKRFTLSNPISHPFRRFLIAVLSIAALAFSIQPANATAATTPSPANRKWVAEIHLSGTLQDCPRGFSFSLFNWGNHHQPALTTTMALIKKAIADPHISGLFFDLHGFALTLTQAQELGQLITQARKAHKPVWFYSTNYSENTYLLAAHANCILMSPQGNIFIPGASLQLMFFRGLLQKLHIHANMIQIGKYKGAEEPFTRYSASKAFSSQVEGLVNGWYSQIVDTIADHRPDMTESSAENAINQGWLTAQMASKEHLIDGLVSRPEMRHLVETTFMGGCRLERHYGMPVTKPMKINSPFALLQLLGSPHHKPRSTEPAVAVICASGVIMDDSPINDQNASVITPFGIGRALQLVENNPDIKAVVLRVDSPGGSAQASESIWQLLHACKKPVYVSMGSEAASGGYYISTAGKKIFADPGSIVGSIGVVGGKIVIGGLFKQVGLGVESFSKGDHADLFDSTMSFTPAQRTYVAKLMRHTYKLFTRRVMEARGSHIKNISLVARGRLFTGRSAIKAGLVDKIGSLNNTVAAVAKAAGIHTPYRLVVLPRPMSLSQIIRQKLGLDASLPVGLKAMMTGLPGGFRTQIMQMYQMLTVLRSDDVLLAAPLGVATN